jgi:hypothetical protein
MKKLDIYNSIYFAVFIIGISAFTCQKEAQPKLDYIGVWQTQNATINVRKMHGMFRYNFSPISIPVVLTINRDGTAKCLFGNKETKPLKILLNKGNVNKNGVIYIINCGKPGKLSNSDPNEKKRLELWVKPLDDSGKLSVEIRQMDVFDAFPMGELLLTKNVKRVIN